MEQCFIIYFYYKEKNMKKLGIYLFTSWILISCVCLLQGCSGTGFDKQTTLMPDRIGVSIGQERYKSDDVARRGFTISAGWDLK
jgi:hypothetical protein